MLRQFTVLTDINFNTGHGEMASKVLRQIIIKQVITKLQEDNQILINEVHFVLFFSFKKGQYNCKVGEALKIKNKKTQVEWQNGISMIRFHIAIAIFPLF